jgi:ketosteroid isomerase-like protein
MRRLFLLLLFTVMFVGLGKGQETAASGSDSVEEVKKQILEMEHEQDEAIRTGDLAALDRIYADDIAYTLGNGEMVTKAEHLANFRSGQRKFDSFKHENVRIHVYGDTVVLTALSTSVLHYKGVLSEGPRQITHVYVKQNGQWRLVADCVTDIPKH